MKRHKEWELYGKFYTYRDWMRKLRKEYRLLGDRAGAHDHKLQLVLHNWGKKAWAWTGDKRK